MINHTAVQSAGPSLPPSPWIPRGGHVNPPRPFLPIYNRIIQQALTKLFAPIWRDNTGIAFFKLWENCPGTYRPHGPCLALAVHGSNPIGLVLTGSESLPRPPFLRLQPCLPAPRAASLEYPG